MNSSGVKNMQINEFTLEHDSTATFKKLEGLTSYNTMWSGSKAQNKKEMIFNNNKKGSFINGKIVQHNQDITTKLDIIDRLMGKYHGANDIKGQFLKMVVTDGERLVHGRDTGRYNKQIRGTINGADETYGDMSSIESKS